MMKSRRTQAMARRRRALRSDYNAQAVDLNGVTRKGIGVTKEERLRETAARAAVGEGELRGIGSPSRRLTAAEREELTQLRRRVKTLERERDMLQEATAFFATLSVKSSDKWRRRRPSIR